MPDERGIDFAEDFCEHPLLDALDKRFGSQRGDGDGGQCPSEDGLPGHPRQCRYPNLMTRWKKIVYLRSDDKVLGELVQ